MESILMKKSIRLEAFRPRSEALQLRFRLGISIPLTNSSGVSCCPVEMMQVWHWLGGQAISWFSPIRSPKREKLIWNTKKTLNTGQSTTNSCAINARSSSQRDVTTASLPRWTKRPEFSACREPVTWTLMDYQTLTTNQVALTSLCSVNTVSKTVTSMR